MCVSVVVNLSTDGEWHPCNVSHFLALVRLSTAWATRYQDIGYELASPCPEFLHQTEHIHARTHTHMDIHVRACRATAPL